MLALSLFFLEKKNQQFIINYTERDNGRPW